MNNNNLFNTNTFIGTTHQDYFKVSSNALSTQINITSNILEQHLNYTSNILDIRASNFTTTTSNLILTRYDKLINEKNEDILLPIPTTLKHTYIMNSNILGEIRFWCKSTNDFIVVNPLGVPDYRVKIDVDGKLKVYYTYDPAINLTFFNGWVDVGNSIAALNASDANIGAAIGGLEAQISTNFNYLEGQITALLASMLGHDVIDADTFNDINTSLELFRISEFVEPNSINNVFNNIRVAFNTARIGYINDAITGILYNISLNPVTATFLGIGGVAFGFAVGYIQNEGYLNTISARINENLSSNTVISSTRRANVLTSNSADIITTYTELCSNMYNFSLAQGFINSNITTQQYLSNLKCDNLYLNNGNISGINYVNVNNIVADGKIKENNKFLDTTYLTSNHLYNLAYTYTAERQYPSKLYTTTSIQDTVSLLGKLVYHQILYLDNQSITYGSGFYEIYSSSTYDTPTTKDRLFNRNTSETTTSPRWAISLYNSGTGNYQGDNSIVSGYFGDWVIIKMPQSILLTRYRIYQRSDFLTKAPAEWKVYGSNDGVNFIEITEASQMTRLSSYTSGFYEKTLASTFTTQYQYFGFTFGKLLSTSGQTDLSFSELQLFGKEIISNSIVSNIYTTSNICKNLIIYDTPEVCKHFAFYILINTPIVIGSTTYYKYDIDLSQYTKKGYIQIGSGSNDPYRIFKIRAFYASSYFGTLVGGLPDVIYADIFMSFKAAASALGQAGLNVCSIGNISNPSLTAVPPNNLFFMRNGANSIDHITVVSKSVADVRVVIEDLLS